MFRTQSPGPSELAAHRLTRAELATMLEHVFYRAKGDTRRELAERMPDAYQRLTGIDDGTLACLTSSRIRKLRDAGRAHVLADVSLNNGSNGHILTNYADAFDGTPATPEGVKG